MYISTNDQKTEVEDLNTQQQGDNQFASEKQIVEMMHLCQQKGLQFPKPPGSVFPYHAFTFRDLPNGDYPVAQYHRDMLLAKMMCTGETGHKWPYGYNIPEASKYTFWFESKKCSITKRMIHLYTNGYYMNPVERYAVTLAFGIQTIKGLNDPSVETVMNEYNSKRKLHLVHMHKNREICLLYPPVQQTVNF